MLYEDGLTAEILRQDPDNPHVYRVRDEKGRELDLSDDEFVLA